MPVWLGRGENLDLRVQLPEAGTIPAGFVFIAASACRTGRSARLETLPDFCMARYEVTCGEYLAFLNDPATLAEIDRPDGGVRRVPRAAPRERALWPRGGDGHFALPAGANADAAVVSVDLEDARAYAAWYDRRHGDPRWRFALPTEAEWEQAARGADGRVFPWGNAFDPALCRMKDSAARVEPGAGTGPVGEFPGDESPYGVRDLAGNAAEWTETGDDAAGWAVKGGSWTSEAVWCRADSRDLDQAWEVDDENGVRLVARRR
ncbi:MAG: SUMF1/EgtB/PvdO family nonheme iron enzyme [Planctomycetes bacterium]|nr:SUMF1/EgtB/PvdO family nonheme iron enzyme [Planctomycetota bacterium]